MARLKVTGVLLGLMAFTFGCSSDPGPVSKPVKVSGKVLFADGKPLSGLTISFSPETATQRGGRGKISPDGTFEAEVGPGKQYPIIEDESGKNPLFAKVPEDYKKIKVENIVVIPSSGGNIDISIK